MELNKAFKLINHLANNRSVTSKSIQEAFASEIDIRTAQRYKGVLESYPEHIAVNSDGSLTLRDNSCFRKLILEKVPPAITFNAEQINSAPADGKKIVVKSGSFTPYETVRPILNTLLEYVQEQEIEIAYKKKVFAVKPYLIVLENGFWSLKGICEAKKEVMSFKLNRIKKVSPLSPPRFFKSENSVIEGIINQPLKSVEAAVLIDVDVADYFKDRDIFISQKLAEEKQDGSIKLTFSAADKLDFILQAAPWACFIKVLSPKKYRNAFANYLKIALKKNS
ncbi:MAG: WYL domain-containing protein [Deferribacteraceae bacterium]|jgi:predicted DNA-binding transcriptional regulator YafY|nr:WYL domain-containing protein [Deferribacteraceae bacterium]